MSHQPQQKDRQRHRQCPVSNDIGTSSGPTSAIVETLEHRRFAEFCDACKKYRYIGLCYGSPGVGKTLSARHYANWERVQTYWSHQSQSKPLFKEVSRSSVAFYTAPVVATPGHLEREIEKARRLLHHAAIDRTRRYEHLRMIRLLNRAEKLRGRHRNPEGYRSAEADKAENAYLDQRDRAMRVEGTVPDPTALLVIDEAGSLPGGGTVRNSEIHLVAIHSTRITAGIEDVAGLTVDKHLDWRVGHLEWVRREWLAWVNARAEPQTAPVLW